ncbi:MAG: long-chain-fatty-acid--CoA ligase [Gammaproteobacteria bacterium]|nr:long-chain-fatty-acid--CoA ligase [Gammaproteobacteria bacterium]
MQLTQALHRAVALRPDGLATICGNRRHTFTQFRDRVARLASALRALGVGAGDRVGILSLNTDRYVEAYMGIPWAGAAFNPINTRWSSSEIAHSLDDCDTRVLLVDDAFAPLSIELKAKSRSLATLIHVGDQPTPEGMRSYETLIATHDPVPDAGCRGKDLAGVFYTGGTTGHPKGVMLSHEAFVYNGLVLANEGMARAGDIALHAAPMFHIADFCMFNAQWLVGGTHVALPGFTPLATLQALQRERVTATVLVPTMIQMVVDHPEVSRFDLSSLRMLAYGGSPIHEALLDRAQELLPAARFMQVYGMTELAPTISVLSPEMHSGEGRATGRLRSGGLPCTGINVRIVAPDGEDVSRGEVGEIIVRSPSVMLGYWGKSEETAAVLERAPNAGWMHTGDGGRIDEAGFLYVVDRVKDMIVSGGENVYSIEVEQAVAKHPAVAACAVIGVPDPQWGERVHAVIVLKMGQHATGAEIREHCKTLIGGYKCPRSVEFVAALPVTGAGKVLKRNLRESYWRDQDRGVS